MLQAALDILTAHTRRIAQTDISLGHILSLKLSSRFLGYYGQIQEIKTILEVACESSDVLGMLAPYLVKIQMIPGKGPGSLMSFLFFVMLFSKLSFLFPRLLPPVYPVNISVTV